MARQKKMRLEFEGFYYKELKRLAEERNVSPTDILKAAITQRII